MGSRRGKPGVPVEWIVHAEVAGMASCPKKSGFLKCYPVQTNSMASGIPLVVFFFQPWSGHLLVHFPKLTWNPKINVWKMIVLFKENDFQAPIIQFWWKPTETWLIFSPCKLFWAVNHSILMEQLVCALWDLSPAQHRFFTPSNRSVFQAIRRQGLLDVVFVYWGVGC